MVLLSDMNDIILTIYEGFNVMVNSFSGLAQYCSNYIANALELLQSCF